jgi:hypothetical protein
MAVDYSPYKVGDHEALSSTKFDNFVQGAQDSVNNIGDLTKMGFSAGQIFGLDQIKQGGATSGQALQWNGTAWVAVTLGGTSFALISDSTLGGDGTFSFTSIPSTYRHLVMAMYLRSDRASAEDALGIKFNNDVGTNYDAYLVKNSGGGPTTAASETIAGTSASLGNAVPGNTATANQFGSLWVVVPNYANAANNKILHVIGGKKVGTSSGDFHALIGLGAWRSNSAINRIDLAPSGGGTNFKTGSRATLYGI